MKNVVGHAVRGLLLASVALLLFDTPAAYIALRGWSPWLSLIAGALTFPLLPVTWHLLRERQRRKAPPAKSHTTGWERLLFRSLVVGLVVIGSLLGLAGPRRVWSGLRHHALWFVPDSVEPLAADSRLFDQLPPDTQALMWLRLTADTRAQLTRALPALDQVSRALRASDVVAAQGPSGILLVEQGDAEVVQSFVDVIAGFQGKLGNPLDKSVLAGSLVRRPDGVRYWVSDAWSKSVGTGRPSALLELIPRAPADAFLVVATTGKALRGKGPQPTAVVAYLRIAEGRLLLVTTGVFASEAVAEQALTGGDLTPLTELQGARCWTAVDGRLAYERHGQAIELRASVGLDELRSLPGCLGK